MRIALAQTNPRIGDQAAIAQQIRGMVAQAQAGGADLVIFPELASLGYPPRDLLARRRLVLAQWLMVQELAQELPIPCLMGCVEPLYDEGLAPYLANALVLLDQGQLRASYHKRLLPSYDVFDEQRYFCPGSMAEVVEVAGHRIGLSICEDIWSADFSGVRYRQDPLGDLAGRCDLVVNVSASPFHGSKPTLRRHMLSTAAARVGCPIAYVNQVGGNDELLFDGDSLLIGPDGQTYGGAGRWQEALVVVDSKQPQALQAVPEDIPDLAQALRLGIRDYCRKTGQQRLVLGLSGGLDSALVAALASQALGPEAVIGLLMPGPYSSAGSLSDAWESVRLLGIQGYEMPIGNANQGLLRVLKPLFAGTEAGIAEENLQSRLRGTLVMGVANKCQAMALSTGNKSELAVGYCTIYGDMNGGLAPLADVYKSTCYALAAFLNQEQACIPENSIHKPPSAELRPEQKDSDSLPPYEVLDRILMAYIEEERGLEDLLLAGEDAETLRRVIRLVEVNEYKRRQAAPSLRVSRKAFGVGRRMPLARGLEPV